MTSRQYRRLTGYKPVQDDLERVNCPRAGTPFHQQCGVHRNTGMPRFMPANVRRRTPMPLTTAGLNLRNKRWWHSGPNLMRRSIRFMCTRFDAIRSWRVYRPNDLLTRCYQHCEPAIQPDAPEQVYPFNSLLYRG